MSKTRAINLSLLIVCLNEENLVDKSMLSIHKGASVKRVKKRIQKKVVPKNSHFKELYTASGMLLNEGYLITDYEQELQNSNNEVYLKYAKRKDFFIKLLRKLLALLAMTIPMANILSDILYVSLQPFGNESLRIASIFFLFLYPAVLAAMAINSVRHLGIADIFRRARVCTLVFLTGLLNLEVNEIQFLKRSFRNRIRSSKVSNEFKIKAIVNYPAITRAQKLVDFILCGFPQVLVQGINNFAFTSGMWTSLPLGSYLLSWMSMVISLYLFILIDEEDSVWGVMYRLYKIKDFLEKGILYYKKRLAVVHQAGGMLENSLEIQNKDIESSRNAEIDEKLRSFARYYRKQARIDKELESFKRGLGTKKRMAVSHTLQKARTLYTSDDGYDYSKILRSFQQGLTELDDLIDYSSELFSKKDSEIIFGIVFMDKQLRKMFDANPKIFTKNKIFLILEEDLEVILSDLLAEHPKINIHLRNETLQLMRPSILSYKPLCLIGQPASRQRKLRSKMKTIVETFTKYFDNEKEENYKSSKSRELELAEEEPKKNEELAEALNTKS